MTNIKDRFEGLAQSLNERLPFFRKVLAVVWILGMSVQAFAIEDAPFWIPIPFIAAMIGYVVRPDLFRPILVSTVVLAMSGLIVFAHVYFRTILMTPVIIFTGLGMVGVILSFYGRGPVTFLMGVGLSLGSSLAFPQNPLFTSPRSETECRSHVDAIEQRLTPYLTERFENPRAARLPQRPEWPTAQPFYLLEVGPRGKWFGDPLPEDVERAAVELRARVAGPQGSLPHIFLAVDTGVPVREISTLLRHLPSTIIWVTAIKRPGPLGPPPKGAETFANALASAHDAGERARILSLELSRRVGPCKSASRQASLITKAPPEDRARFMVEELSSGLRDCQCSYVDLDALEYLMKVLLDVPEHEFGAKLIPRDSSGKLMLPDSDLSFGEWSASL